MKTPHLKNAVILRDGEEVWFGEAIIPDEDAKRRFLGMSLLATASRIADDLKGTPKYIHGQDKVEIYRDDKVVTTLTLELREPLDPERN